MRKQLSQIKIQEKVKVLEVKDDFLKRNLLNFGLMPGSVIKVERWAPLGDPIQININGVLISLRKKEAEKVIVEN